MGRYLLARIAWAGPIVLAILVINFLIIHVMPGDPVQALVDDLRLTLSYTTLGRKLRALQGVSLSVDEGEAVGLVGESGSGKSTVARVALA